VSNPFTRKDRPLSDISPALWVALVTTVSIQVFWHWQRPGPEAQAVDLVSPPPSIVLGATLSRLLMLRLQAFDNQPGISIPFRDLNYTNVAAWLDRILTLDPRNQYPLLAASRLYAAVPVPDKQRVMMEWVYQRFLEDPNARWQWLAHITYMAKHRLKDLPLALKYAQALREYATATTVPDWAKQMEIFVLEDMGELEAAMVLLGGLIESGEAKDPAERAFLEQRLEELQARAADQTSPSGD
jgi:hypothetical protein